MRRYHVEVGGRTHVIDVQEITGRKFTVVVEGQQLEVTLSAAEDVVETVISPEIAPAHNGNGNGNGHGRAPKPLSAAEFRPAAPHTLPPMVKATPPPKTPGEPQNVISGGPLKAPMPGVINSIETKAGAVVKTGQVLVKLEAMKMVNAIKSPRDGVVAEVRVQAGQSVAYGEVLVTFKEA